MKMSLVNLAYIKSNVKFDPKLRHQIVQTIFGKPEAKTKLFELQDIILTKALVVELNKLAREDEPDYTCAFKVGEGAPTVYTDKNEVSFRLASTHPGRWDAEDAIGEFYINLSSGEVEFSMDTY